MLAAFLNLSLAYVAEDESGKGVLSSLLDFDIHLSVKYGADWLRMYDCEQ
jgi:hypothetical protein